MLCGKGRVQITIDRYINRFFLPTNVQRKRKKERNHIFEAEASKPPSAEDETKIPIEANRLLIRKQ
jgi:hypothetical protein